MYYLTLLTNQVNSDDDDDDYDESTKTRYFLLVTCHILYFSQLFKTVKTYVRVKTTNNQLIFTNELL